MNIDGVNPLGGVDPADSKPESDLQEVRREKTEEPTKADSVQVGTDSEIARLNSELDKIPELREERVEELRSAIEQGSYDASSDDIATVILEELI